ncbi:MAG: FUSC family protein [Bacteroidetes bacterium]|nr:FUSC family protein [Bacteroidota bacterium]MBS1650257.1 FUSC family protein [Bacteroidota bacterium]
MNERIQSLLIYAAKCATGSLAVFILAALFHYHDIAWSLISVMLVLSADGKDSMQLALTRIKANIIGAAVGVLCLVVVQPNMWFITLALCITLSLCYLFKLDAGIRSALAATIIILLHEEGKHLWDTALERIIAVLAGCVLGLIITFLFHFKTKIGIKKEINSNHQEA